MDNIYDHITSGMNNLPEDEKIKFFKEFWASLSRDKKVVFVMDAMQSFERDGTIQEFLRDVNKNRSKKQDAIMDEYLDGNIDQKELERKMKVARNIETKTPEKK